jgi:hypothetical protein
MTDAENYIAEAAQLPLKDAAYELWRLRPRLNNIEGPMMTPEEVKIALARSPAEVFAKVRHDHDHADEGPTFGRLKRAHPQARDEDIKAAIRAAVKFDDDCNKYFVVDSTDYWDRIVRAVMLAARKSPGYLERTYESARHSLAYYMK